MFVEQSLSRSDKLYVLQVALFTTVLVLSNIIGTKLFVLAMPSSLTGFLPETIILTAGIITYPMTFWFTDVVSEIWGKSRADLMVMYGFLCSLIMLLILVVAKALPPAEIWQMDASSAEIFNPALLIKNAAGEVTGISSKASQAAYSFTFDAPGTLLFASMLAYLCAQLLDNYLFHFWRRVTDGKHLWLRNNGSTGISQLADTIIVNSIFLHFYWKMPSGLIVKIIITTYICKLIMALIDTPLIYAGVFALKRVLGREVGAEKKL